jgi:hypothetical protein
MMDRMSRTLASGSLPYAAPIRFPVEPCDILVTIAGVEPQVKAGKTGQKCPKKTARVFREAFIPPRHRFAGFRRAKAEKS